MFIIVSSETTPIIGLKTSERLNLVQRVFKINCSEPFNPQEIPDEYFDCFGEVGTLKNTYHIELKEDVKPVVVLPRNESEQTSLLKSLVEKTYATKYELQFIKR